VKEKKEKAVVTYVDDTPVGHKKGSVQLFSTFYTQLSSSFLYLQVSVEALIYQCTLLGSEHTVMCVSSLT